MACKQCEEYKAEVDYVYERLVTINCILADENIDMVVKYIEDKFPWVEPDVDSREGVR